MARRGGHKQRRREGAVDVRESGEHSPLWLLLIQKFSLGKLTALAVQQFADAAVKSGSTAADLHTLQALGSHASSKQNCRRDLMRKYFKDLTAPVPKQVQSELLCRDAAGQLVPTWKSLCFFLTDGQVLLEAVTASTDILKSFWREQDKLGALSGNPFLQGIDYETDPPIPFSLHGDGAPYSETDSLKVVSMRQEAAWRSTQGMPEVEHPLMAVSGITPWSIRLDSLRLIDLGCAAHLFGNLVWELLEDHIPGPNRQARLNALNKQILESYKACGIPASKRIKRLNLSDICSDEYPCFKHIKGRRIRYFRKVAVELASLHTETLWGKKRLEAVKAMAASYDLADLPSYAFSPSDYKKYKKQCENFLGNYGWLAKNAMKQNLCRRKTHWYVKGEDTAHPDFQDWKYLEGCDSQILVPPDEASQDEAGSLQAEMGPEKSEDANAAGKPEPAEAPLNAAGKLEPAVCSSALPLQWCLQRRALALDQVRLSSCQTKWINQLLTTMNTPPPPGHGKISLEQLIKADRQLWTEMSKAFTGAVVAAVGADDPPFDEHVLRLRDDPRVTMFLLPLPILAKSASSGQPSQVSTPSAKATPKLRPNKKAKATRKAKKNKPEALTGMETVTKDGHNVCWAYNLESGCQSQVISGSKPLRCSKGLHVCALCHKPNHSQAVCNLKKRSN
eukprot:s145_g14.t1